MHPALRITLYAVLAVVAVFCGHRFLQAYSQRMDRAAQRYESVETPTPTAAGATTEAEPEATNAAAATETNEPTAPATNQVSAAATDTAPAEPETAATNGPVVAAPAAPPQVAAPQRSPFGLYAALALAAVVGLALLIAGDVSHYVAARAHRALSSDEGETTATPEYEQAEQAWANGDYMEALRLLREHLNRHPRELHVAFRIAEIYEKDLANHLAAALEYEEILKQRLPRDRWGWSAIHLCNLYNRLNQPGKTEALLRRIVEEYGETPAAGKARERLGIPEQEAEEAPPEPTPEAPTEGPKLPPGFRPKKKR